MLKTRIEWSTAAWVTACLSVGLLIAYTRGSGIHGIGDALTCALLGVVGTTFVLMLAILVKHFS